MFGARGRVMSVRIRLPNRRGHEVLELQHGEIRYVAGLGYFDDGRLGEIFLSSQKIGTSIDVVARDASILASLALQHGADVETLRRALTRNEDGSASGPLGGVLDLLATERAC